MDLPEFNEIFRQIKYNLKLCGVPSDDSVLGLNFFIPIIGLILMLIEELAFFCSKISSENFLELTALAPCIGIGVLSLAKFLYIAFKRREIFKLIAYLDELYDEILHDAVKKAVVAKEVILLKRITKYYFVLNAILISVYNFSTLLLMLVEYFTKGTVTFMLPYAVIVPFSTDNLRNWLIIYTQSVLCGFICVIYYTSIDALYCNLTSQVCGNFTIISKQLELLTPATAYTLRDIVKRHQFILQLSDMLEEIFSVPNFFNVLVGSVEICALGFNIMTGDLVSMPGYILFLLSEILQILVMSVFGENIMRESTGVGDAALLSDWYNMDHKYKKMLLIIIVRSQKPQQLTAYKFSKISYGSFTKIISTSWSYFTILKTVYKPSNVVQNN